MTEKAGIILFNEKFTKVALVYRKNLNDWSFPKGHLEPNETIKECALRETAEETKRDAEILNYPPILEEYTTPKGEHCRCTMFLGKDIGKSANNSPDTHPTYFIPVEECESKLSYNNLKLVWNKAKEYLNIK